MLAPHPSKSAPLAVGRYLLNGRAGHGLPGAFRARDPETDALVTVFLFPPESAGGSRPADSFVASAEYKHPNFLAVLDHGRDGQTGYLVTEWVEGTTLARMIEAHARLPEGNVIRFLAQIGQALDHTRAGDTAPCRVTPRNILLRADGVAKLVPFELPGEEATPVVPVRGVSKQEPTRRIAGRAAPEPVPFAEAVFSLGTTLFEALTGQVWVRPEPPGPSRRSRRPVARPAGLTDRAERAVKRATDLDPAKRPASCAEFLKLLRPRPLTAGTPKVDARPAADGTDDRRAFVRYALGAGANCQINTSLFDGGPTTSEVWPLVVQDVSAGGIGLLLARRCEPGTELSVELPSGPDRTPRALPVTVVRVRKDQYGHWVHGCAFLTPIGNADLEALLTQIGAD